MESPSKGGPPGAEPLLRMDEVSLRYGHIRALSGINLAIGAAEIHAIVGEHGAGKSSLAKVMCGLVRPVSGRLVFCGTSYASLSAEKARAIGIEMVFQEMQVFSHLRVVDTFYLKQAPSGIFPELIRLGRQAEEVDRFLRRCGFSLDAMAFLKDLTRSEQLLVEILKSLFQKPRLLILDEVFERLSALDLEKVIAALEGMKAGGMSIVLITHRIDDIYAYADRVSVLKNGEMLLSAGVGSIDKMNLIKLTYTQISREEHLNDISKEFYQYLKYNEAILQYLPVILLVVDGENRIKMANQYARDFFGIDRRHLLNRPVQELFASAAAPAGRRIHKALGSRQKKVFYSLPLELNGRRTINNLIVFPIEDGTFIIGRIIIIEDLTEHEKMRDQLILSEKLASVGLLAAGVAHEINNPLGIITNYLQSIRFKHPEGELNDKLARIGDQIQYIAHIVGNLLTFSDSGRVAAEEIDLNELIEEMIELVRYSARKSAIRIDFTRHPDPVALRASRNEMKQVILNLFKNSFEAMPNGGEIGISTQRVAERSGETLLIRFRDNGPGIQHENLTDIFLPFSTTKKGGKDNVGLGLYVSYGIVQKYHGEIAVENLDSGCQFTIRIPR